ncbi:FmdB family zinc ribbon protein [Streptantibioticus silvisoli]|uniref:Zinc ribbon domain-containing protein n=1 Tax=Streptantibioticus silvisoli TaxID=2705255 RepID=A0ABT6W8N9_9ACTN|nr:FmdB family zinc ribbon protein [Streptantibioticus silvisoli]MDI5967122.1 zinc ribbon domain-containing protein [Streptantibioticus silvisoli]
MPTYQYQCTECGEALEAVQKFTDDALTECPNCSGRLRKVFSAVGVVFKGSGFYRNDSRGSSSSSSTAKSSESKSESKAESKSDSKSETKSSGTKSDSKGSAKSDSKPSAPASSGSGTSAA